jgi:transcriptional regulator of acetoin/glycerol metabolism
MRIAWDHSPAASDVRARADELRLSARYSHGERVAVALEGHDGDPRTEEVLESWRRSVALHRLDPAALHGPRYVSDVELRRAREPLDQLLRVAQAELDQLYELVRRAGYLVLLSDAAGTVVEHRQHDAGEPLKRMIGSFLGSIWSENSEGTNGIGTCLAERRAVTVHRNQHFRVYNKTFSCSAVPVRDPKGELVAVLDVTSLNPANSEHAHALTIPLLEASVAALEERLFRDHFSGAWVIALPAMSEPRPMLLLAVDRDQRIIGADLFARSELGLSELDDGVALTSLFSYDRAPFRRRDGMDSIVHFQPRAGGDMRPSIVTAPLAFQSASVTAVDAALRLRSRRSLISEVQRMAVSAPQRGALTAGALRRVSAHVEAHLHESIGLEVLAQEANLSVYHFARAFKLAVGMPPHRYVMEQRVLRAKGLLQSTDRAVAEIAQEVGFADQSHFSRHFGRLMGLTPTAFRRAFR